MKILLVEDSQLSRRSLAGFLKMLGHVIVESDDGVTALEKLKEEKFHMVLSDIKMPRMDGIELLKNIKKTDAVKDTLVVLFTGFGEVNSAVEALRNGAYDYLLKPINVEELAHLTKKASEFLALKEDNIQLKENFQNKVKEATKEISEELSHIKAAYAKQMGTAGIGIFSEASRRIFQTAREFHNNRDLTVLIEGETGTGKEVVARYIHYGDGGITSPFIAINCAAISPGLFESELFGYEAGAFTGGNPKGQKGKLELAKGGTLFLDEISEMASEHQAKLLRVIQEREFYRVGGVRKIDVDVRIICATNQNLKKCVAEGSFRQDLYFRLNVGQIYLPPLQDRPEEIIPLANMFLKEIHHTKKTPPEIITPEAEKALLKHDWPGNIRELKNAMERVSLLCNEAEMKAGHLDFLSAGGAFNIPSPYSAGKAAADLFELPSQGLDLNKWIIKLVKLTLDKFNWNKTDTAQYLGISRSVLYTYLKHIENN
ncbi:sigma-54-dependent Fis family transcriptional regulator [bacterium]|nr:sigma-54-dependent Fis family transcriptional regulator [bacterium]